MPKLSSVYRQIIHDFPDIQFTIGDDFLWSYQDKKIAHPEIKNEHDLAYLLHEVGHSQLGHSSYSRDILLLRMEQDAWQYAVDHLASAYASSVSMDDDIVNESLDSYRHWLNARSTCPYCQAIGLETDSGQYTCLICKKTWTVNEARSCQLRRYKQKHSL